MYEVKQTITRLLKMSIDRDRMARDLRRLKGKATPDELKDKLSVVRR
jgi:hypothetical protein